MKLVFLVYDSRSGSTLLSRELSDTFAEVVVTPELRFDGLLKYTDTWLDSASSSDLAGLLCQFRFDTKLDWSFEALRESLSRPTRQAGLEGIIRTLVQNLAAASGRRPPAVAVIKSGMHLRVWRKIRRRLPQASFVYMVRDPRAVVHSKLNTPRPYVEGQTMAWAGVFAASLRWRLYCAKVESIIANGGDVHVVRYEDLLETHEPTMTGLANFLDCAPSPHVGRYSVPRAEQAIHRNVEVDGIVAERMNAWRGSLHANDQATVEILCSSYMRRWRYPPEKELTRLAAAMVLIGSLSNSVAKIAMETLRRSWSAVVRRPHAGPK